MKYECGPFICDEGCKVTDIAKMAKGCNKREEYEDEIVS